MIVLRAGQLAARGGKWEHVYASFLLLTYCVFPAVSQTVFQTFSCDDDFDNGESFLRLDYNISCTSNQYKSYRAYSIFMVFIYPIGVPLFYAVSLYRARKVLDPSAAARKSRSFPRRASRASR